MSHDHHNHHNHSHSGNKKVLRISFVIIATYMVVEIIGGLLTNSLALLSDAGHMFSDAAALALSLGRCDDEGGDAVAGVTAIAASC